MLWFVVELGDSKPRFFSATAAAARIGDMEVEDE